jgi:hypothetical protein
MPYAVTAAVVCVFCGTIPASWGWSPWLGLIFGAAAVVGFTRVVGRAAAMQELQSE